MDITDRDFVAGRGEVTGYVVGAAPAAQAATKGTLEQEAEIFARNMVLARGLDPTIEAMVRLGAKLGYIAGSNDAIKNYPPWASNGELEGLRAFKRMVDEALNSGDGVYRP